MAIEWESGYLIYKWENLSTPYGSSRTFLGSIYIYMGYDLEG